ncbi:hypothetical protein ACFZA2_15395 [Microbacterium sp. NPDC007973]|uniref:hypothetical protein n=1 Tax=Microbacterium sp. NPDC007973 TaxID=3364182 RepID=UPI0036F08465
MLLWSRLVLVMRFVAIGWAAVVGVWSGLVYYELIDPKPSLEPWGWIASIVLIGVENAGTLIVRRFRSRSTDQNARIESTLKTALLQVTQSREVTYQDLGASVFVPTLWSRVRRHSGAQVRLKRISRFRPAGYPQQSGVSWTGAKGVIGTALRSKTHSYTDFSPIIRRYGVDPIPLPVFNSLPGRFKLGLDLDEFNSAIGKYSEIVAIPIWQDGKDRGLIGVLSIDRAYEADESENRVLNRRATRETAATAAASIGSILKPKVTEA